MWSKNQNQVELYSAGTTKQDTGKESLALPTPNLSWQLKNDEEETQAPEKHWAINSIQIGSSVGKKLMLVFLIYFEPMSV